MKIRDIYEAYNVDGADKYDGIDRDIYNWMRNEQHLTWDDHEVDEARSKYGNVSVGTVYRGMKINNKRTLELLETIKQNGHGTVRLNLDSASKNHYEAMSFALYVKSYDEMTMMWELSDAMKRGSAGLFGTALLTLTPTPDQVIVKTYSDGTETTDNPLWQQPPQPYEQEIILKGDIPVSAVEIFYPLTRDNWRDTLRKQLTDISNLSSNPFISRWLAEKVPSEEVSEFGRELLTSLIKTDDDVFTLLTKGSIFSDDVLWLVPQVNKFARTYMDTDTGEIMYHGTKIHVSHKYRRTHSDLATGIDKRFQQLLDGWSQKPLLQHNRSNWAFDYTDELQMIVDMASLKPALISKFKNHPALIKINNDIIHNVKDIVTTTEDYISKNQNEFSNRLDTTTTMLEYLVPLLINRTPIINSLVQYIATKMTTHGAITPDKEKAISLQKRSIQNHMGRILALKNR